MLSLRNKESSHETLSLSFIPILSFPSKLLSVVPLGFDTEES